MKWTWHHDGVDYSVNESSSWKVLGGRREREIERGIERGIERWREIECGIERDRVRDRER